VPYLRCFPRGRIGTLDLQPRADHGLDRPTSNSFLASVLAAHRLSGWSRHTRNRRSRRGRREPLRDLAYSRLKEKLTVDIKSGMEAAFVTLAEWTIFAAVILYLATVAPVKAIGYKAFDNSNPRSPAFYKPGIATRALGAHLNGIETFPFFAVSVLLAEFRQLPQNWIDELAVAFVVIRLLFVVAYLTNRSTIRTLLWNLGFAVNAVIFFMPWWGRS